MTRAPSASLTLTQALSDPLPCKCNCHETLTVAQRELDVRALYRFEDAMRGWGYEPLWDPGAHAHWRAAQLANDATYRGVPVRDHACLHRRLVGFVTHELLHALVGDPSCANYGVPFGLPYGVPLDVPFGAEKEFLHPYNVMEARAFVGVAPLAEALFGIDWAVYTARDVGTYGFPGGPATVPVPDGYRAIPHYDRQLQPDRYYLLARRLEADARTWLTPSVLADLVTRVEAAERAGRRATPHPDPAKLAALPRRKIGRNDPCPCGSGEKYKNCCSRTVLANLT